MPHFSRSTWLETHFFGRLDLCFHFSLPPGGSGRIIIKNVNLCLRTCDLLSVYIAICYRYAATSFISFFLQCIPDLKFMANCYVSVINFCPTRRRPISDYVYAVNCFSLPAIFSARIFQRKLTHFACSLKNLWNL